MRQKLRNHVRMTVQARNHFLFSSPQKVFALQPDIVLQTPDMCVVMDTKWKILSGIGPTKGISQADMYQMYAYGKKYAAEKVVLLYPMIEEREKALQVVFHSNDKVTVEAAFVNLLDVDKSVDDLLTRTINSVLC